MNAQTSTSEDCLHALGFYLLYQSTNKANSESEKNMSMFDNQSPTRDARFASVLKERRKTCVIEFEDEYGDTKIQSGINVIEKSLRATRRVLFRIGFRDGWMQMDTIQRSTSQLRFLCSVIWIRTLRHNPIDLFQANIVVEISVERNDFAYLQEYCERLAQRLMSPMRMSQ